MAERGVWCGFALNVLARLRPLRLAAQQQRVHQVPHREQQRALSLGH